ncbi:hypothetical protein BDN70DRAFT_841612 [Pholiota conissans]|uniref:Peptidase C14 caspase domain-containing protein n=1 Tax=Pholiota conissans TaxID=109636 RepID=A0A9P6CQD9_9AGAR|nr:hypothetical protein BDN70DRAFT_841612 [Pholiota conissans]
MENQTSPQGRGERINTQPSRTNWSDFQISSSSPPSYVCYHKHLAAKKLGVPIWIPEPNENLSVDYRKRGTSIGDVVIFTPDGALDFLFNICLPAGDPVNANRVPEGFKPFVLDSIAHGTRKYQYFQDNSYLASKSIKKDMGHDLPSGVFFKSTTSDGAILTMPEGAWLEEVTRFPGFNQYLSENLNSWYHYVNNVLGWGVIRGDLHLVYGVHKANAWGIATFESEQTEAVKIDINLRFKPKEEPPYGTLYSWEYQGVLDSSPRMGPTKQQRQSLFASLPRDEQGKTFKNQCLFVRTINSMPNTRERRAPSQAEGAVNRVDAHIASDASQSPDDHTRPDQNSLAATSRSTQQHNAPRGVDMRYDVSIRRNGPALREHPSKAINNFLLEQNPTARIAITNDDHWISLLTRDDLVVPEREELLTRLKKSYKFVEEKGIISLESLIEMEATTSQNNNRPEKEIYSDFVTCPPDAVPMNPPTSAPQFYPTKEVSSMKTRLFAVLIGINKYQASDSTGKFTNLRGAVLDARKFQAYLENILGVPRNQIVLIINEDATRDAIVKTLRNLAEDPRIDRDDAILIYYAGHGTEIDPPPHWEVGDPKAKIQAIVPYDCDVYKNGQYVAPIPDHSLEVLLSKIAEKKGNNITVIFDCCYTVFWAELPQARSIELPHRVYTNLDSDIVDRELIWDSSTFFHRGLGSHILLAACQPTELATEENVHGRFSASLLKLLNKVPAEQLCYSTILAHPLFERIPGQRPRCEGSNLDRMLFSKSFRVTYDQNANSGDGKYADQDAINNIRPVDKFSIYRESVSQPV